MSNYNLPYDIIFKIIKYLPLDGDKYTHIIIFYYIFNNLIKECDYSLFHNYYNI